MEIAFMVFGLGFFIYVIWMVQVAEERTYQRKLNEAREFGTHVPQEKSRKKSRKDTNLT